MSTAPKREPYHISNDHDFLPSPDESQFDFVIICSDKDICSGYKGSYFAVGNKSQALSDASSFFKERISLAATGDMWINAEAPLEIVLLLLSAAFEKPRYSYLGQATWANLLKALELAHLWRFDSARTNLFYALLLRLGRDDGDFEGIAGVFCEAQLHGYGAYDHVYDVVMLRKAAGLPPIKATFGYPGHYTASPSNGLEPEEVRYAFDAFLDEKVLVERRDRRA